MASQAAHRPSSCRNCSPTSEAFCEYDAHALCVDRVMSRVLLPDYHARVILLAYRLVSLLKGDKHDRVPTYEPAL
jgi:hypothetical protein